MLFYFLQRGVIILLLLAGGVFCLHKMLTVRPHRLKKERRYCFAFRDDLPDGAPGEELASFSASRGNLLGSALSLALVAAVAALGLATRDPYCGLYLIPLLLLLVHTLREGTKRVRIHQNGIVVGDILGSRYHSYNDLDWLESYNVVNSFFRGVSYGYRFLGGGQPLLAMDARQYAGVDRIEAVFDAHSELKKPFDLPEEAWE